MSLRKIIFTFLMASLGFMAHGMAANESDQPRKGYMLSLPSEEDMSVGHRYNAAFTIDRARERCEKLDNRKCDATATVNYSSQDFNTYIARIQQVASTAQPPISKEALEKTIQFLKDNQGRLDKVIKNRNVVTINDFTETSLENRMIILNLDTGKIERYGVAHGIGSGEGPKVYHCSNGMGSKETPPGFHVIKTENKHSSFGSALYLQGLEARNSNSERRNVVLHPNKSAATREAIRRQYGFIDLSEGCTQMTQEDYYKVKSRLQGGSLMYNFCPEDAHK